jgi:hypothetical protein
VNVCRVGVGFKDCMVKVAQNHVGIAGLVIMSTRSPLFYFVCPDVLSLVGDPLSGDVCGSPNHI